MLTFLFSLTHTLKNATRRHKYFRGLSRLLPVSGVLVSFSKLWFLRKMSLLIDESPLSEVKSSFSRKMNAVKLLNAINSKNCGKIREGNGTYLFAVVCGVFRGVDEKQVSKWHLFLNSLPPFAKCHETSQIFTED